ncbi:MAG: asparagine synthase (glutamine-hydrolyzing) [Ignavibacteria bacterium]|nr:asparagine synthase (glutamine-hydrolyzing) [Ignavibacteria bacterium]
MCGIAGSFNSKGNINIDKIIGSTEMITYRGPDDFGYLFLRNDFGVEDYNRNTFGNRKTNANYKGAFGFRRLSIIDLSESGHQPMCDISRKYWIEFNGEIYNYLEIRKELEDKGYKFRSKSDTEVILYSYIEWGDDCVLRFNGMWSFCILDLNKRLLFCSVDRFGIKPFYYYSDGTDFFFGSEVKQVLLMMNCERNINQKVLFDYLIAESYGNETEETFIESVKKILPGHNLIIDISGSQFRIKDNLYWELKVNEDYFRLNDEKYISDKIKELFFDSVRIRLRSDVEIGTCLSGGPDSSGIVCTIHELTDSRQKLFTILSGNGKNNELDYALDVVKKVGGEHYTKYVDEANFYNEMKDLIWHNDEPLLKASMYGGYQVYKLASEAGLKVVMDGQGLDEYAGGYFSMPFPEYLNYLTRNKKRGLLKSQLNFSGDVGGYSPMQLFIAQHKYTMKKRLHDILGNDFRVKLKNSAKGWFEKDFIFENISKSQLYKKVKYEEKYLDRDDIKSKDYKLFKYTNLPGILRQVDRNSMAFSVEARVPFLDYRLVEFIFSIPSEYIIRNNFTKYSYRQSMRGIVPDRILNRTDKIGFYIDEFELLRKSKDVVKKVIEELKTDNGIVKKEFILKSLDKLLSDRNEYDSKLWRIFNFIIWQQLFQIT